MTIRFVAESSSRGGVSLALGLSKHVVDDGGKPARAQIEGEAVAGDGYALHQQPHDARLLGQKQRRPEVVELVKGGRPPRARRWPAFPGARPSFHHYTASSLTNSAGAICDGVVVRLDRQTIKPQNHLTIK